MRHTLSKYSTGLISKRSTSSVFSLTGLFIFVLLTLCSFSLVAQEEGGTGELFIESLDVNLINVDVYVTDRKGNRVKGLTAEDFEVTEDGRSVKISNFYAVADGRPVEQLKTLERARPETPTAEPKTPEAPADQRLSLIVYIDNLHIRPFNRNKVLSHVRSFLRTKMKDQGQAMLVTFERTLKIQEPFTDSYDKIAEATYELEDMSAFAVQRETERDNIIKRILRAREPNEAEASADFYAKSVYNDLEISIRGMREMVSILAGLPGRKALLYVSDGLEMRAGQDLFELAVKEHPNLQNRGGVSLQAARYDSRRRIQEVIAQANANRVTFYTLEAAGLRSHSSLSAERGGGVSTIDIDFTYQLNRQETLLMLADDTGGLASINTNNFAGALDNMATDFNTYYSLGYLSSESGDGRFHRIKVKVKKKGLKVRHRDGYRDKTLTTRITEGTLASLLHGIGESNPLNASVHLLDPVLDDKRKMLLPVEVRVPIGGLALIPREGLHNGRIMVSIAVMDDDGEMSPVDLQSVPIQIPERDLNIAKGKYYVYSAALQVRPGRNTVAVGVRDEIAGAQSYLRHSTFVGGR